MKRALRLLVLLVLVPLAVCACAAGYSKASVTTPRQDIIGAYEYADVVQHGYSGPAFRYTLCGETGPPTHDGCNLYPGRSVVPIFNSAEAVSQYIREGHPLGRTILLDMEGAVDTTWADHFEYEHLYGFACRAASEAHHAGLDLISAIIPPKTQWVRDEVRMAQCGAWGIELQQQASVGNPDYAPRFMASYLPIEKARPGTRVFAGLGTDPGGWTRSAAQNVIAWRSVQRYAYGYWLNVAFWPNHPGCAPEGCPEVAVQFLREVNR